MSKINYLIKGDEHVIVEADSDTEAFWLAKGFKIASEKQVEKIKAKADKAAAEARAEAEDAELGAVSADNAKQLRGVSKQLEELSAAHDLLAERVDALEAAGAAGAATSDGGGGS